MKVLYIILFLCGIYTTSSAQTTSSPSTHDVAPYLHQDTLVSFLTRTVNYPSEARQKGISGIVKVSFIVEKDGSLSDFTALNQIPYLTDEALRVCRLLPHYIPGISNGNVVRMKMILPISFVLE